MLNQMSRLRLFGIVLAVVTSALSGAPHVASAAQSTDGITTDFYGYFSDNGSATLLLGHLQSNDPTLAAEIVSPEYADDFFSGFTIFSNYGFASSLPYTYIDQIDEADEYMVFSGDLDSYDGVQPGYVIFLSTSQQVFLIMGYQVLIDDLFGLAALTIQQGAAPQQYGDYARIKVSDDGSLEPQSGQRPSSNTGNSGNTGSTRNTGSTATSGNVFCYVDPVLAPLDLDEDRLITLDELELWVGIVPGTEDMIQTMIVNGYDSIQYAGC